MPPYFIVLFIYLFEFADAVPVTEKDKLGHLEAGTFWASDCSMCYFVFSTM